MALLHQSVKGGRVERKGQTGTSSVGKCPTRRRSLAGSHTHSDLSLSLSLDRSIYIYINIQTYIRTHVGTPLPRTTTARCRDSATNPPRFKLLMYDPGLTPGFEVPRGQHIYIYLGQGQKKKACLFLGGWIFFCFFGHPFILLPDQ